MWLRIFCRHIIYGPVRVNEGKWEEPLRASSAGAGRPKGAKVSPDRWKFHWWHETHGGSFVTVSASCPLGRSGGGGNESKQSERPTEASHTCSTPFSVLQHSHQHAISIKIHFFFCYDLAIRLRDFTLSILTEGLNCKRILQKLDCCNPASTLGFRSSILPVSKIECFSVWFWNFTGFHQQSVSFTK